MGDFVKGVASRGVVRGVVTAGISVAKMSLRAKRNWYFMGFGKSGVQSSSL
jgi:hypothetical protein